MTSPERRGRRPSPVAAPRPAMARGAALGTTARGAQTVRLRASFGFFPGLRCSPPEALPLLTDRLGAERLGGGRFGT